MAPPARAEVALVPLKNCLVNLPSSLVSVLNNANVVSNEAPLSSPSTTLIGFIDCPECHY